MTNISQHVLVTPGSFEWYEHRSRYRNASESAAVMGISPWLSKQQLYEQKLGQGAPIAENAAMQHGNHYEPEARGAWNEQYGELDHPYAPAVFTLGPYSASCDGVQDNTQSLVEIKCPMKGSTSQLWKEVAQGKIPKHYRVQIEHQLRCSGAKRGWLWVWDAHTKEGLKSSEIVPDEALWKEIQAAWEAFDTCLKTQTPPASDMLERTDEAWLQLAHQRIQLAQQQQHLTAQLDENRMQLLALCTQDKQRGGGILVNQIKREGSIDYQRIPELKGVDLSQYRKPPVEQVRITLQETPC